MIGLVLLLEFLETAELFVGVVALTLGHVVLNSTLMHYSFFVLEPDAECFVAQDIR